VHYELYSADIAATIDQLSPGLTGLGSLVFRDEEALLEGSGMDSDYVHDQLITPFKGELEKWYAENRSTFMYFKILILTAASVVMPNYDYLRFFDGVPTPGGELQPILDRRS
jgi:lipopolysaccharide/colanic/teichoic acid biosynthesis glycosyltransferase